MAGPFGGRGSRGRENSTTGKLWWLSPFDVPRVRTIRWGDREAIPA